jgi:hypothetical protein
MKKARQTRLEQLGLLPKDMGRTFNARWPETGKWWPYHLKEVRDHPDTPLGGWSEVDGRMFWFSVAEVKLGIAYVPKWEERGDTELDCDVPEATFVSGGQFESKRRRH